MRSFTRRGLSRRARVLLTLGVTALAMVAGLRANADPPPDPRVEETTDQLQQLMTLMSELGDLSQLGNDLPLTEDALADFLQLPRVFDDDALPDDGSFQSIKEKLESASKADWASLASALDSLDGTYGDVGVAVSGPDGDSTSDSVYVLDSSPSSNNTGVVDLAFEIDITYDDAPVPVLFDSPLLNLDGGSTGTFPVDFELHTAVLHFQIDKAAITSTDPGVVAQAVSLRMLPTDTVVTDPAHRTPPGFNVSATAANAPIGSFTANLGFTEINVTGAASFDIDVQSMFQDPDAVDGTGDDKISGDEWATTSLGTLLSASVQDDGATNAVDAVVRLETGLVEPDQFTDPAGHDARLTVVDASLTDGFNPTVNTDPVGFGKLADFRNFTAEDAVSAVERLIQFLDGLQSTGKLDVSLPFLAGGAPNPVDPASNPNGTFSDALRIADQLRETITDANQLGANALRLQEDDPATTVDETGKPSFASVQDMKTRLAAALGITAGDIGLVYSPGNATADPPVPPTIDFTLELTASATKDLAPDLDNLDILSGISVSSASPSMAAGYTLQLPFSLSLKQQPVEDGAGIGSCFDEIDNGTDGADAADPDCAGAQTLEQRVGLNVGQTAGDNELVATLRATAPDIDATARIGMLEGNITNAALRVGGSKDGESAALGLIASCSDGLDNDSDELADGNDPDCNASFTIDFVDTQDGFLTVEDLFNAMGTTPPTGASFSAKLTAAFAGDVPVSATLGSTPIAGGTIKVSTHATNASISGLGVLVDNLVVDASAVRTSNLFDFSPCSNAVDDDGDGDTKINDGCAAVGPDGADEGNQPDPETGTDCDNATDDDGDSAVNDGCPASDNPESSDPFALLNQIVAGLRLLTQNLEENGLVDADDPLPLVGQSFNQLVSYVDKLEALANRISDPSESSIPGACDGAGLTRDDDFDNVRNDGCPSAGTDLSAGPEASGVEGDECDPGNTADDDGDGVVNDGCPPVIPSLNTISSQIEGYLDKLLDDVGTDGPSDSDVTISYTNGAVVFDLDATVEILRTLPLNLNLGTTGQSLVSVDSTGDLFTTITGVLDLDFGLELDGYRPFLLGSTGLTLDAVVEVPSIQLSAAAGPITIQVGDTTPRAETACSGTADDDGDGVANDGCAPVDSPDDDNSDPDAETVCTGAGDEDNDGVANDGCDAVADPAKVHLGGRFTVEEGGPSDDTERHYLSDSDAATEDISFNASLDGLPPDECTPLDTQNTNAGDEKDACAVLPLYLDSDGPGGSPPTPIGDASTQGHHLVLVIADLTSPTLDFNNYDFTAITDAIAAEVIDLLLVNSGLQQLIDLLRGLIEEQLLKFKLPFISDRLSEAAQFLATLDTQLKNAVSGGVGTSTNPLSGDVTARDVQNELDTIRQAIGEALAGILRTSSDTPSTDWRDFVIEMRCTNSNVACDTGGEDDPFNLAAGPSGGSAANCTGTDDDDGDGVANDGCPAVGGDDEDTDENPGGDGETTCTGSGASADNDGDGVANDGCAEVYGHDAAEVNDILLKAKIGKTANLGEANLDFDIGIPGLGLKTKNAKLNGTAAWSLDIAFGINKSTGFYFETSDADELLLNGTFGITGTGSDPASLEANLGFLRIVAIDGDPNTACSTTGPIGTEPCNQAGDNVDDPASSFSANFTIDLKDPDESTADADGDRLSFSELTTASFAKTVAFRFGATADVNLHIETSIAQEAALPKLIGDLHLDWVWSVGTDGGESASSDPGALNPGSGDSGLTISLDHLTLDAGSFVTKFLKPILQDAQRVTEPFQPLIDKLQAPIPVLSDLAGQPITLLDLAETFAPEEYNVDLIVAIIKVVSFVNSFDIPSSGNLQIPIGAGNFTLAATKLQKGELGVGQAREAFANQSQLNIGSLLNEISTKTASAGASPDQTVGGLKDIGLSFPFIEEPAKLLGILFKQDVDLVVFERTLSVGFTYSQKLGPVWATPPVFLEIGGSLSAFVKIGLGYDTQGLRELAFENAPPSALLNGLFIIDYPGNEAELRGELFANAQVSVAIFSAGAGGSVYLTIGVDVNDPNNDGRLKFQEAADIVRSTGNFLCLFTLNGQFGVRIFVFAEVDLFFWSQRWEQTLADLILFEFKVQCAQLQEPELASDAGGGTLLIHMGNDAFRRDNPDSPSDSNGNGPATQSIGKNEIHEKFVISRARQGGQEGVTVEAFGARQFYPGNWTKVKVRDAANGNDSITFADGNAGIEEVCDDNADSDGDNKVNDGCPATKSSSDGTTPTPESGSQCDNSTDDDSDGFVNDGCPALGDILKFNIAIEAHGGDGNDTIQGGTRATASAGSFDDVITGGPGDDTINARGGRNKVVGGAGKDKIVTGEHDDTVWGDNENNSPAIADTTDNLNGDNVNAGAGADSVRGGADNDVLNGGLPHKDPETGALVADGIDNIQGNSGNDTIDGGDAGDTLNGNAGADRINGGNGADTINGGDETPTGAPCDAAEVHDVLVGGPHADRIRAGNGDDIVVGGNTIAGEPDTGDTILDGGDGCDYVFGDNVSLASATDPRAYTLIDPSIGGADRITGGNGKDRLIGQVGDDTIRGDDSIAALADGTAPDDDADDGNDVIEGNAGHDRLYGDGASDNVRGGPGNDDVIGGRGGDTLNGHAGEDIIVGDDGSVNRTPTNGRDDDNAVLLSTGNENGHADTIRGGTERDRIYGELSGDTIFGDEGDDDLYGNEGDDVMYGNTGADYMFGGDGADDMYGGSGNDRMVGGSATAVADNGKDEMYGGTGDDAMAGDDATITTGASITNIPGVALVGEATHGDGDLMYGETGEDVMLGGLGVDVMHGGTDDDHVQGNAAGDTLNGNAGDDDMIGGTTQAASSGADSENEGGQPDDNDTMNGHTGADVMLGDNGRITRPGGASPFLAGAEARDVELFDLDSTNADVSGPDTMNGNESNDMLFGGGDADTLHGNAGDDYVEGNGGGDDIWGDASQDDLIGGTSADAGDDSGGAHPDGADDIWGGDGDADPATPTGDHDVIAGDNASIARFAVGTAVTVDDLDSGRGIVDVARRRVVLYDVATTATPNPTAPGGLATSGGDTVHGEAGHDIAYGQGAGDFLYGEGSDDYLEGGAGSDDAFGGPGQDDIVGGTGRSDSHDANTAQPGRLDDADDLYGGNGVDEPGDEAADGDDYDVIMGDNATILRDLEGSDFQWEVNTFNAAVRRAVWLYDVGIAGTTPHADIAGGDTMRGEADDDVMYGQGENDTMEGDGGDDYMEGNSGVDTVKGETGNDDMLGGTGLINDDPVTGTDGRLDAGETLMSGGPGFDWIAGDNAIIERVLVAGKWRSNTYNDGVEHHPIRLLDINSPVANEVSGGELLIEGNTDDDVIYGQGGGDTIQGNDGDDYIEGNADGDSIEGNLGDDDIVGGTGRLRDEALVVNGRFDGDDSISGEAGSAEGGSDTSGGDFILADNGVIERPLDGDGKWQLHAVRQVVIRSHTLRDVEYADQPAASVDVHGNDQVWGNDNDDVIYGQGGSDALHGNAGDDYIEGNHDADLIFGDADQDDLIGGSVAPNRRDGGDTINGGPHADFQLGDNGTIERTVDTGASPADWTYYDNYNPLTITRLATRHDVGGPLGTSGADTINGNDGDDYQWGQDGDDTMHGDNDNDDMYGELGDDHMFGGFGEDAMVGDRGMIVDTKLPDNTKKVTHDTQGPGFFVYQGLVAGQLDRRVTLTDDGDGAPHPFMGMDTGGADRMRGGPGHDSMHGAFGNDLMNGDSGGDWMFGHDGADVMWGGKGADQSADPTDPADANARDRDSLTFTDPFQDQYLDYLFGGHGGTSGDEVLDADILDYKPRPGLDPPEWFVMTNTDDNTDDPATTANDQHHHGIDWIYGGFDRDVLQGNVGKNGLDFGDRLVDWKGAYNLYTRCNASYGDDGDIYEISPQMLELFNVMAYGSGAGLTADEVRTAGTSAFRELGLVYPSDPGNRGKAFPTTPGHFHQPSCS